MTNLTNKTDHATLNSEFEYQDGCRMNAMFQTEVNDQQLFEPKSLSISIKH